MPLTFASSPFYDDYNPSKEFYKVLFRPGYPVQARELTQLQSIIAEQIARFGQYVFQNGAMVTPGQITYNQQQSYVIVLPNYSSVPVDWAALTPGIQIQDSAGVVATVISVDSTNNVIYIQYTTSGTSGTTKVFADGEVLNILPANTGIAQAISSNSTGVTASASIAAGVYFIFGMLLDVASQTIILSPVNGTPPPLGYSFPNVRVGLEAIETIVTPEIDSSLNSNAIGSPNYAAPGADRYKIVLNLTAIDINATADNNFTELMRIQNGVIQTQVQNTALSEIMTTLAQRTMETNGNFIVSPFGFDLHESLLVGSNGGIYTSAGGGQADQLALGVEPGRAYVDGYRIQTISKQYLPINKARTTNFYQNSHTRAYLGNYVYINRLFGLPNYDQWPSVNLYGTPIVTDGVAPLTSVIGTATIRGLQFQEGNFQSIGNPGPIFEVFLADINITAVGLGIGDVRSFAVSDGVLTTTANVLSQLDIVNVVGDFTVGDTITDGTYVENIYAWDTINNFLLTLPVTVSGSKTIAISNNVPITSASGTANILQRITLFDTPDNILLYQLPQSTVSTVRDLSDDVSTSYSYRKVFSAVAQNPTYGTVTFATGVNEIFEALSVEDYVATIETGSSAGSAGTLIDIVPSASFASGLSQISFNAPVGTTVKLSATVIKEIAAEKTKTLNSQSLTVLSSLYTGATSLVNLGKADIFALDSIIDNDTSTDITDWYTLDNGQRDNRYDFGQLTLLPGYPAPSSITITFRYFTHSSGDYFSVNSYNNFITSPAGIDWYALIPYYVSSGTLYALRDCLDFRPRVDDVSVFPPVAAVPTVPTYTTVGGLVKPNDDIVTDFSYYLGRVDKLYLSSSGAFIDLQGTPALQPLAPPDPTDGMVLAILTLPAYTFVPSSVTIKTLPNKVYTMADIGNLDKRITNLEYYTALNLLEQTTASMQIPDATTGLNRYQAGFIVDPFQNMNVADYNNPDISFSIDAANGIMRPEYVTNSVNMQYDSVESDNIEVNTLKPLNNIATLPYTESPIITQPLASRQENINPYNIFAWAGSISLTPATDTWIAVDYLPDITITDNTLFNATQAQDQADNILGTVWNAWTTNWIGVSTSVSNPNNINVGPGGNSDTSIMGAVGSAAAQGVPVLPTNTLASTTTTLSQQTRNGTQTTLVNVPTQTIDNKIVSTGVVPYCRANNISFVAKGLKPLTQFWAFMDITPVSSFCTPTGGTLGEKLMSDANGMVSGVFALPNPSTSTVQFRTGTRIFSLVNDINNVGANITSYAQANYIASGTLDNDQETITSIGVPELQTQQVTQTGAVQSTNQITTYVIVGGAGYVDPLAQAFLVGTLQGGFCATSIDLYFATKDPTIPVTLQIRTMVNGTPTQTVVPYSTVVLNPSQINVDPVNGAIKTNFAFPSPVYLQQGEEYAIVLLSNSNAYFIWTALLGDYSLNTDILISQVPYAGSMFKSQNASTWVPSPGEAYKFTLYRAVFDYLKVGTLIVENPTLPTLTLPNLSMITYNGTNVIRILHPNHGMPAGSLVTLTIPPGVGNANWAASYNGIPVSDIIPTSSGAFRASGWTSGISIADNVVGSRTYQIKNVELNSYTIFIVNASNVADDASSSGYTGVSCSVTQNYPYDVMMPIVNELNFSGTSTNYYLRGISETSADGTQIPYEYIVSGTFPFTQFVPNVNFNLSQPQLVASAVNEQYLINHGTAFANKSLVWEINLTSTSDNLSPMIDLTRISALLISNLIDNRITATNPASSPAGVEPIYVSETINQGATDAAKYITLPVTLATTANSLQVWLTVMWPYAAQVDVYYKILPTNTNATFTSQPYVLILPDPNTDFSPAQNSTDFKDYYWQTDTLGPLPDFTQFAIKVVLRSTNSSAVPLCQQFRCIALES